MAYTESLQEITYIHGGRTKVCTGRPWLEGSAFHS